MTNATQLSTSASAALVGSRPAAHVQSAGLTGTEMLTRFEFLTIDETCATMRVGRSTIHRMFARKELTPLKIGGRTVVRSSEIRAYLDALPVASHG
jgi:excisionase family DNA binding protein